MVLAGGAFRAMAGINRWLCSVYIGRDLTVFEVRNEEMNTSAVKHRQGGSGPSSLGQHIGSTAQRAAVVGVRLYPEPHQNMGRYSWF
jgi:hypothetical protein